MPCLVRTMRDALVSKLGCEESEGRKHTKYKLFRDGQIIATTLISHGASEIGDSLISRIATELCIQTQVLKRIYGCTYGLAEYLECYNPDLNSRRN